MHLKLSKEITTKNVIFGPAVLFFIFYCVDLHRLMEAMIRKSWKKSNSNLSIFAVNIILFRFNLEKEK